ncbi:MAG: 16S rRNA (cytosine(967)-C(5))-methyltransferase RsmB [Hyphomicrobiales bacterium]
MTMPRPSSPRTQAARRVTDPRRLAVRLLGDLERGRKTLDALMEGLDETADLRDPRDRDLLNALVFGVLRWRGRLDYLIARFSKTPLSKLDSPILNVLRTALFQLVFMTRIPPSAAVHTAVNLAKTLSAPWVGAFVNAVLRKAAAEHATVGFPDPEDEPVKALAAVWSFPEWLVKRWIDRYGREQAAELCESINSIPSLTLRVNTLKATRSEVIAALLPEAEKVEAAAAAPDGIRVHGPRKRLKALAGFQQGWYQVQDEAAQLVSLLLAPCPGETVLDGCAGRGGKTGHMAQLMGNRGVLVALDPSSARLTELRQEMQRLGVSIVSSLEAGLDTPIAAAPRQGFDRVLLDAPCSGLGTLRRNPDIKWAAGRKDLRRYHDIQLRLLKQAAGHVKAGGVLVYAVCSPEPEETVDVIHAFVAKNPEFTSDGHAPDLPESVRPLMDPQGFLQTYPHLRYMDGFFAARLRRAV